MEHILEIKKQARQELSLAWDPLQLCLRFLKVGRIVNIEPKRILKLFCWDACRINLGKKFDDTAPARIQDFQGGRKTDPGIYGKQWLPTFGGKRHDGIRIGSVRKQ